MLVFTNRLTTKWPIGVALLFVGFAAWATSVLLHRHDIELTLSCSPELSEDLLEVTAIAGAERITWNVLHPGESVHAWLDPDGQSSQLHLSFRYVGRSVDWQSTGQTDQVVLTIDRRGAVLAQ